MSSSIVSLLYSASVLFSSKRFLFKVSIRAVCSFSKGFSTLSISFPYSPDSAFFFVFPSLLSFSISLSIRSSSLFLRRIFSSVSSFQVVWTFVFSVSNFLRRDVSLTRSSWALLPVFLPIVCIKEIYFPSNSAIAVEVCLKSSVKFTSCLCKFHLVPHAWSFWMSSSKCCFVSRIVLFNSSRLFLNCINSSSYPSFNFRSAFCAIYSRIAAVFSLITFPSFDNSAL